jgi:hypothetical protein
VPYICRESFAGPDNRVVVFGQEVPDDDPIVVGREAMFVKSETSLPKGPASYGPDDEAPAPSSRRRRARGGEG